MRLLLVSLCFLLLVTGGSSSRLAERMLSSGKDAAQYLMMQAQELAVETVGVAFRHWQRFMLAAGGEAAALKLLLEAVAEFKTFVVEYREDMLTLIREAFRMAGNAAADNEEEITALYRDLRGEVVAFLDWAQAEPRRASDVFRQGAGRASALAEKHQQGVADLIKHFVEHDVKDFKKKHKRLIRRIKREVKDRADEFDDDRNHDVDHLLDFQLDHIANGFVIECRFNLVRYYARIAISAVKAHFSDKSILELQYSDAPWNEARRGERLCIRKCNRDRRFRMALFGWTQERNSVAGRTFKCELRCTARYRVLRPHYFRYLYCQAVRCDPQNGIIHHAGAHLFADKDSSKFKRHEGFVTCARRCQRRFLSDALERDTEQHREFFSFERLGNAAAPRIAAAADAVASLARPAVGHVVDAAAEGLSQSRLELP